MINGFRRPLRKSEEQMNDDNDISLSPPSMSEHKDPMEGLVHLASSMFQMREQRDNEDSDEIRSSSNFEDQQTRSNTQGMESILNFMMSLAQPVKPVAQPVQPDEGGPAEYQTDDDTTQSSKKPSKRSTAHWLSKDKKEKIRNAFHIVNESQRNAERFIQVITMREVSCDSDMSGSEYEGLLNTLISFFFPEMQNPRLRNLVTILRIALQ
jgi:hypothetical protein